jgi:cholesterol transport system auxiliary component
VRDFPRRTGSARGQLVVADPSALAVLDTDKIMVRPGPGQIAQLASGQWSDRLPRLLQARIVQSFENANRLRRVGRPGERVSADFQLMIDIRAFNIVVGAEPTAEVELSVKIVADRAGRILSAQVFRAVVPTSATDGPEAVRAIDTAFGQVATELVVWTSRVV